MTYRFLSVEAVVALHAVLIEETGGSHGLRDVGLLESAVARARNCVSYNPEATLADVAASLSWGLIRNQAFVDGNKRIGLAAMVVFLKAHGYVLRCSAPEETTMVLCAASSQIAEDEWTDWVGRNVAPEG